MKQFLSCLTILSILTLNTAAIDPPRILPASPSANDSEIEAALQKYEKLRATYPKASKLKNFSDRGWLELSRSEQDLILRHQTSILMDLRLFLIPDLTTFSDESLLDERITVTDIRLYPKRVMHLLNLKSINDVGPAMMILMVFQQFRLPTPPPDKSLLEIQETLTSFATNNPAKATSDEASEKPAGTWEYGLAVDESATPRPTPERRGQPRWMPNPDQLGDEFFDELTDRDDQRDLIAAQIQYLYRLGFSLNPLNLVKITAEERERFDIPFHPALIPIRSLQLWKKNSYVKAVKAANLDSKGVLEHENRLNRCDLFWMKQ